MTAAFSRRQFVTRGGLLFAVAAGKPDILFSRDVPDAAAAKFRRYSDMAVSAKLKVAPIREGLTLLTGTPGNNMVLLGRGASEDGALLVDTGYAGGSDVLKSTLLEIDPAPVRRVVNTSRHWDHVGGNAMLAGQGAKIFASRIAGKRMRDVEWVPQFQLATPAIPAEGRPSGIVDHPTTLRGGTTNILLRPLEPGPTDGDLIVHFEEPNVLVMGDMLAIGHYQFIDYGNGGSLDGVIANLKFAADLCTSSTIVVPGHGPLGRREDLTFTHDMFATLQHDIAKLITEGLTLDEIVERHPSSAFDHKFSADTPELKRYIVELVHDGITHRWAHG